MKMQILTLVVVTVISCQSPARQQEQKELLQSAELDTATFAGGCFWCVEASFEQIQGVAEAVSGYAGGDAKTADYQMVSSGRTKHAETVQVYYDPKAISFDQLLDIFFTAHDPTQLNRQGPDVGAQYRSAIFYHSEEQKQQAEKKIKQLASSYEDKIVTQLNAYSTFYPAEDYHQDYEENHPNDPYIMSVSRPKIRRVKEKFKELVKEEYLD